MNSNCIFIVLGLGMRGVVNLTCCTHIFQDVFTSVNVDQIGDDIFYSDQNCVSEAKTEVFAHSFQCGLSTEP